MIDGEKTFLSSFDSTLKNSLKEHEENALVK